jgi:rare lipoprotein A
LNLLESRGQAGTKIVADMHHITRALPEVATYGRVPVLMDMRFLFKGMRHCAAVSLTTLAASALLTLQVWAAESAKAPSASQPAIPKIDHSGKKQVGEASIYADKFANKKMADGNRMDPNDDNAAHKTLPLGTKARVTNLESGQSTQVTIQDRGPFVKGRIIDLPPSKAEEIGLTLEDGVAKVKVEPIEVPMPDGSKKMVDGAKGKKR